MQKDNINVVDNVQEKPNREVTMYSRKTVLPIFITVILVAFIALFVMQSLQPTLIEMKTETVLTKDYNTWFDGILEGNISDKILWIIGDLSEGTFHKSVLASIFYIGFAFVGSYLEKKNSKYAGTGVGGNSSMFTQTIIVAILSVSLAVVLYDSYFEYGWIPTFTPFIVSQALMYFYRYSFKKSVTIILGAGTMTFPAVFYLGRLIAPLGLPGFVQSGLGMVITVIIFTEVARFLPWMKKEEPSCTTAPSDCASELSEQEETPKAFNKSDEYKFYLTRIFADAGDCEFSGSSWGGFGLFLGLVISWVINPQHGLYGSGLVPVIIFAQICTAALGIFVYYPQYKENGFAFTFPGMLFVTAVLVAFPATWQIVLSTIIVAGLAFEPLIKWLMKVTNYQGRWHVTTYVLTCVAFVTTVWSFFIMNFLLP